MTRSSRWLPCLAAAALLTACGGEAPRDETAEREASPAPAEDAVQPGQDVAPAGEAAPVSLERTEGRVSLSGTDEVPMVRLRPEEGRAVTLTGALLPELSLLSGATVAVEGTRSGSGMLTQFEVVSYEIVGIDGVRPVVGILEQRGTSFRIATDEGAVPLSDVPDALARNVGGKVWVTGTRAGGVLQVESFGVIRYP